MYTETEAAKRMCPKPTPDCFRCAGSKCMAWRWANPAIRKTVPIVKATAAAGAVDDKGYPRPAALNGWDFEPADVDSPAMWVEPIEQASMRATGFCGLAGTPPDVVAGVIRSQVRGE